MSARFSLVLAGGGVRGFAHVGVLSALEQAGMRPSAVVGVSMGAIVATTYAAREDWYEALTGLDLTRVNARFPGEEGGEGLLGRTAHLAHTAWNMVTGWGAPSDTVNAARDVLDELLGSARLEEGRVPVAVAATDLIRGERVVFRTGRSADAAYASAALAGVAPPLEREGMLLVDGAYSDLAPVDVARSFGSGPVIVVDPGQSSGALATHNGIEAALRAMEICHRCHAELRFAQADLVIRPRFRRAIGVFEVGEAAHCVAAGAAAAAREVPSIAAIFESDG